MNRINDPDVSNDSFVSLSDITDYLSVSRSTVFRLRKSGAFPQGVTFTPKVQRWRKGDILKYARRAAENQPNAASDPVSYLTDQISGKRA